MKALRLFDLLRQYPESPELFGDLFREFADAFKGKRQLVWTKGLKELLAVDEKRMRKSYLKLKKKAFDK